MTSEISLMERFWGFTHLVKLPFSLTYGSFGVSPSWISSNLICSVISYFDKIVFFFHFFILFVVFCMITQQSIHFFLCLWVEQSASILFRSISNLSHSLKNCEVVFNVIIIRWRGRKNGLSEAWWHPKLFACYHWPLAGSTSSSSSHT